MPHSLIQIGEIPAAQGFPVIITVIQRKSASIVLLADRQLGDIIGTLASLMVYPG
ncbi:MAG: hypothetical protein ACLFV1_07565 [Thiohalophilus sp.]